MKFFNTAGPVNKEMHYKLNPLQRWNLDEILMLIAQQKYFILHAPRQTGKTSSLLALQKYLNAGDDYISIYANFEAAQPCRNNFTQALGVIIQELKLRTAKIIGRIDELNTIQANVMQSDKTAAALNSFLKALCNLVDKPVILLIDEIDSLIGDTLISVLRQLRSGYDDRPEDFPHSITLCGVVDIKDYKIHQSNGDIITGGSCFNIKSKSLRLGNFSKDEIKKLYQEHTRETGQEFEAKVFDLAWNYTAGQPWLVNALAYEACFEMKENRERSVVITADIFQQAKENLINRRETHLDQLSDKLKENRVKNVIEAILAADDDIPGNVSNDDLQYVIDLGLIEKRGGIVISNDIYREVIPRELTWVVQSTMTLEQQWFVNENGSLNMPALIEGFQKFFRKNSESWIQTFSYREAGPQLLLQAFLQRVVNGGGIIEREYGLGSKRTDLYIKMPHKDGIQEVVMELKIQRGSRENTIQKALVQTKEYMDKCGTEEGHILIFDRNSETPWEDKIFSDQESYKTDGISVWGM